MLVNSQVGQEFMLVNFIGITGCHADAGRLTSNTGVHAGQIYRF